MDRTNRKITPLLCPKCKSPNFMIKEWIKGYFLWDVGDFEYINHINVDRYLKVTCHCKMCKKRWTVSKCKYVDEKLKKRCLLTLERKEKWN